MSDGIKALEVNPESSLNQAKECLELITPSNNWAWAAFFLAHDSPEMWAGATGARFVIDAEVTAGKIGIYAFGSDTFVPISIEHTISAPHRERILIDVSTVPKGFCIRNSDGGQSQVKIFQHSATALRRYNITPILSEVLPLLLAQRPTVLSALAEAISAAQDREVTPGEIGSLSLDGAAYPVQFPDLEVIFNDEVAKLILSEMSELASLAETFHQSRDHVEHMSSFTADYLRAYCRQTTIRVYYLAHLLREQGLIRGSILEIGSLMGNFAAPLQRLGYEVTAVDRYESYGNALDEYIRHMRQLGVKVLSTTRENENKIIAGLDKFDAVISMAVIEHIPHTPRLFLEMLASRVKSGGILALDTPNHARYWNRLAMAEGRSVNQPIDIQFACEPPYEGHHREYTGKELIWMLEQVGCKDITLKYFDYNILQFATLERQHAEALLAMTTDPTQADTLLAAGRF